ncbi:MAG: hypothetical protein HKK66_03300 [Chlorobiaceae bacterium]|nr:hypothetical protein [Chlorobiaceae bacterium]
MAKKAELYSEAERLYVQEHLGQTDIAERLGVAERTIRYWATEGNWAERRGNYVEATSKTSEKLYKLVQTLTDKAIESVENGEVPSQSQLFFISKMAPLLLKLQNYEESSAPAKQDEADKAKTATRYEDVMQEMQKTLMQLGLG